MEWFDEGARFLEVFGRAAEDSRMPNGTRVLESIEEAYTLLAEIKS